MTLVILILVATVSFLYYQLKKEQAKYPYPIAFHTADIALYRKTATGYEVCMGQKEKELSSPYWRFPGGFVDPTDTSAEAAALRECSEEVKGIIRDGKPEYITSTRINDERFFGSRDKIITSFYKVRYISGVIQPGDDLAAVKWMAIDERNLINVNPIHRELFRELLINFNIK